MWANPPRTPPLAPCVPPFLGAETLGGLAGPDCHPSLPPSTQAPGRVPHAFQQLNEDRDASVCPAGCWAPPWGGGQPGKAPGRVGAATVLLLQLTPAHVWGSRCTLGMCSAPLATHRPFPGSGPCAVCVCVASGCDDSGQAVTAKHGASATLHTSLVCPLNLDINPRGHPIFIPVFEA